MSGGPDFESKLVDVVELYLNPPANALVLRVDEKPQVSGTGASGSCVGSEAVGWIEIEAIEMEQDGVLEALAVAEAASWSLDALHLGVDGFATGVCDTQRHGFDDAPELLAAHPRHTLDWLEP